MTMIYSKDNTTVLYRVISGKVFICAQGETEACSIIEKVDGITPDVLEDMKNMVQSNIVKIIANEKDYGLLKPALGMVFDDVKYVNREGGYELYFQPTPPVIRAAKEKAKTDEGNISSIQKKVKVLVIDDSKTICNLLRKIMDLSPNIEVVDAVNDPLLADEAIQKHKPDVITLDIHMPGLNGVELIKQIQPKYNIPAIMISSISMSEGPLVLDALDSGAVDYIQKPDMSNFAAIANEINSTILAASKVTARKSVKKAKQITSSTGVDINDTLMVIGASTGGTKALKDVLDDLPAQIPPILIVQHIPAEFSKAFADRLNETAKFTVKEALHGDKVVPNQVLIAPGGTQMKFIDKDGDMSIEINDDAPVNRFKPSVDYLFDSVANSTTKKQIVAAIFTGMGRDGAVGMKNLKSKKMAATLAQDEETSVVFGMPKEAIKLGAVDHVVPLDEAAHKLIDVCIECAQKKAN